MNRQLKVLGVVPARGGSKGIPRKNLALVEGRPVIEYTFDAIKQSSKLKNALVSTDDSEIAEVAKRSGIWVPFMRPQELAQDSTPTLDVLVHLCHWLRDSTEDYDAVCLLQPTSPQRTGKLIDECISAFENSDADSLITVCPVPHQFNPHWVYFMRDSRLLELSTREVEPIPRRQLLPPAYHRDGRIYLTRLSTILEQGSLLGRSVMGYEVEPGVNIDSAQDLNDFRDWIRSRHFGET